MAGGISIISLVLRAGVVVKFVLLILLFFSVFSWAIIFYKYKLFKSVERESEEFQSAFLKSKDMETLYQTTRSLRLSPLANLFRAVYPLEDVDSEAIKRSLKRVEAAETAKLERYLTFLATTGSTTPFIGLFGTVWGIMDSFIGIGKMGSASLAIVAPGIAEALIATAAGLAAAVPAVIAYNYYLSRVRRNVMMMEDFSQELIAHLVRGYGEAKTGAF